MPLRLLALAVTLAVLAPCAAAQFATPTAPFVQAGAGAAPGLGVQVGLSSPALTVFTQEGMLYADYRYGADERLLVGFGVGGSVRLLRIVTVVADAEPAPLELDAGLRFGPSFAFAFAEQTAATQVRQFRLFADPFVRGVTRLGGSLVGYAELGWQPGRMRVGFLAGI